MMKNKQKKILILGGNGFVGKNLSKYLRDRKYFVSSFDLEIPEDKIKGVEYFSGNFFSIEDLKEVIKGQDIIFHCISTITPGTSTAQYERAFSQDFLYTVKLLTFLENTNVKLIFLSSGGTVYGEPISIPVQEDAKLAPLQYYGCLKICIEELLQTTNRLKKTNHKIARISNPYGEGQDPEKGVGFINIALQKCILGETIDIWGDGENFRDYIYISNVCGMLHAIALDESKIDVFNVSSGFGESQNGILNIMKNLGLNPNIRYTAARTIDVKSIILDNTKIRKIYTKDIISIDTGIKNLSNTILKLN